VIPLATLIELLDQVPPRYRALVLLATFASLRSGSRPGCGGDRSTWTAAQFASWSQPPRPTMAG
jgi:hypothetical protein